MRSLRIKRRCKPNVDAKQALRAYVEQLPIEQQRAFVAMATQLIATHNRNDATVQRQSFPQR